MIYELAEYENMTDLVEGNPQLLSDDIENKRAHSFVLEVDSEAAGYAIYFFNYSTFKTKRGLYLEDVYVKPKFRKLGLGKKLFLRVKEEAINLKCGRMEWSCLDWNEPSIGFYKSLGAHSVREWVIWRFDECDLAPQKGE